VTLVLAGAAALVGCSRGAESGGKRYATREECVADWGNNEEDCKEQVSRTGHGASSWIYYGAASSLFRGNGMGVRSNTGVQDTSGTTTRSVSRGGFGSTGRSGVSS